MVTSVGGVTALQRAFRFQTKGENEGEIAFECKCP